MPNILRADAPSRPVRVRLSPLERRNFERAAALGQQTISEFLRDAGRRAAAVRLKKGVRSGAEIVSA